MKKIMILGASLLQFPAIKKAKDMGLDVVVVDMNPNAIGFNIPNVKKEVISTNDKLSVLQAAKKHNINAILTIASDRPVMTVSYVAKELGLIGISEESALKATNKSIMRKCLKDNNIPIPIFYVAKSLEECYSSIQKIKKRGSNVILKPSDNSGSRGIVFLSDFSKEFIKRCYEYTKKYSYNGDILVEEFMEGPEVSVESIVVKNKCNIIQITDKLTSGVPYFVEMGHSQPSILPHKIKEEIEKITIEANKAIGIENSPSHTEIKITEDGPKIVEIGARLGGDNIANQLTFLSTGIDMVEDSIKLSLGEDVDIKKKYRKASAIRYFDVGQGIIKDIKNIEEAKKIRDVVQIEFTLGKGDVVNKITNSADRVGFVITQSDNVKSAIRWAEMARDTIDIELN